MIEETLRKADVPYLWRPAYVRVGGAFFACFGVALVVGVPDTRPGLLELVIGIALGLPAGLVYAPQYVNYIRSVALAGRHQDWGRQAAVLANFPVTADWWPRLGVGMALGAFAVFGISGIIAWLHGLAPKLGLPWARFVLSDDTFLPVQSWIPAVLAYGATVACVTARRVLRWYDSLPD